MFTSHFPRSRKNIGSSPKSSVKRVGASIGICALTAGFALAGPATASAATMPTSYGEGQFLSGTILGVDLNSIVELTPAYASNNGSQGTQNSNDPQSVTLLETVGVNNSSDARVSLGDILNAGALHQFAQAAQDGSSMSRSGALVDNGGIGVGDLLPSTSGDVDLNLDSLLGSKYAAVLTDLNISLDAVAAEAKASLTSASGDYTLAGATLTFTSPAIAQLTPKVNTALVPVDAAIASLGSGDGILATAVDAVVDPVLAPIGSSASVTAAVTADVHGAVQPLLTGVYGDGAVRFNLQTGVVSVDLAALLGGKINNLSPGTELLSGPVVDQILNGITTTVSTLSDQIVARVKATLLDAQVTVRADLDLLSAQGSRVGQVCRNIQVPVIGDIVAPITGGLLGGLPGSGTSGTVTKGIVGYTTKSVCDVVTTALPALRSTATVDVRGTVKQLLAGTASTAAASVSLLGGTVAAKIDVHLIVDGLAAGLTDSLFDSDSAVAKLVDHLDTALVNPAIAGLLGNTSVHAVLSSVVSVKVNLQELSTGAHGSKDAMFTQTAVRVTVLRDAGPSSGATLNLAQASVGPNVTRIVDECVSNCGTGTGTGTSATDPDPTCTSACSGIGTAAPAQLGGADDAFGTAMASPANRLAYTGVGIATLIAVILALLAAGAYLAREGHRRSRAKTIPVD